MTPPKFKIVADWIITALCPLRCEHCIVLELVTNAKARKAEELNTKECKELVDFLYEHGTRVLSITGGEPLTRSDLFEIIDYARAKGMKVFLYTTGLRFIDLSTGKLRTEYVQQVLGRVDYLGISLDTFHDDTYQQLKATEYCEKLVRALFSYAAPTFPDLQIQLFTVLGRRNGIASVEEVITGCTYIANVINTVSSEIGIPIRWRLSPFRFNPGSMLDWQQKLLFSPEEIQSIEQELVRRFEGSPQFTMHFGVDYDSFFIYPDGKLRTVGLDENGIDRFTELGTFKDRVLVRPEVWEELHQKDGQTAKRMRRLDILKLHGEKP